MLILAICFDSLSWIEKTYSPLMRILLIREVSADKLRQCHDAARKVLILKYPAAFQEEKDNTKLYDAKKFRNVS